MEWASNLIMVRKRLKLSSRQSQSKVRMMKKIQIQILPLSRPFQKLNMGTSLLGIQVSHLYQGCPQLPDPQPTEESQKSCQSKKLLFIRRNKDSWDRL